MSEILSIDDFSKVELRAGTVVSAEPVEGSEKLLKVLVDIGEESPRQVLAGMAQFYTPQGLTGMQVVVVANLAPRMMMGLESQGMLLAAGDTPVLLSPGKHVKNGSKIR